MLSPFWSVVQRVRKWISKKQSLTLRSMNKRGGVDRERVNGEIQHRMELIAHRDNLDLDKPADRLAAQAKVFAEYPGLYKRYADANTVRVGKVSMSD